MQRTILNYLKNWLYSEQRKPLILRGARQVGKTWAVRQLAQMESKQLIELNFEKRFQIASLFESNQPKQILLNIESIYNQSINPEHTILFLDEIQAAPEILSKLRWFAEELPELPIIAAGSLLEFTLDQHSFSMPVGRITYAHLEPLSFDEFLLAHGYTHLIHFLAQYQLGDIVPIVIHQELMALIHEYVIIGGMPEVVANWVKHKNLTEMSRLQHDLLATYRDDFAKYAGKTPCSRLDEVMLSVPRMLGERFIFSHVNQDIQSSTVKEALQLLLKARLCHKISSTHANGLPLGAEIRETVFKIIFIDLGLVCSLLGLGFQQITAAKELNFINQGGLSEQLVGQLLRTITPFFIEPSLHYWTRDLKGSSAEVDYVIQHANHIIPLEVKSGSTGSLKSLHLFMHLKNLPLAVRINSALPVITRIDTKIHDGSMVQYQLLSLPFYLLGQLPRLLNDISNN
ncbi:MAG: ATP-binding protein [Gammaproteobacteria bacterium]|nr:ATP-binding protein [Gammaproteobacteria bacterium]